MAVEIWLKKDEDDRLLIPVNPPTVGSTLTRNYEDIVVASGDEKTVMSGKNLREYTIASFLPKRMTYYNKAASDYTDPIVIVTKIEKWMNSKTVLLLQVTNTVINKPVTIRSFKWEVNHVGDVDYTLELKQYDPITFKAITSGPSSTETVKTVVAPTKTRPASQKVTSGDYTVKTGDSLWTIAKKFYNDGSKTDKIYQANKKVIGPNPNLIQPGMKLVIPE
jgi:LysM repeat protein